MGTNTGTIMTLANSIIGVSVLAMPFCFKQCGIMLSILMLIASSLLSRLACHFLLKSAVLARRRTFEFLAFHTFGFTGKFTVELFIIGFLMGTCIAFFVVMGDLGPAIVAKITGVSNTAALRPSVLIGLAAFVVLPLGMLRNVDSLSSVSMATIAFYICLVLKVIGESLPHLLAGDWYEHVHFWRPAGIMQCIPIFSMALFCQTQLFEIYESMHNASLDRMNYVIRAACNICTGVYICVGFFGYIAFCTQPFTGNVLMSFTPSVVSEMIKLGFVLSVAVSFPLVIFPCRASLYSLLFRRHLHPAEQMKKLLTTSLLRYNVGGNVDFSGLPCKIGVPHHEGVGSHIPEARFKCLTLFIVSVALIIGLLIPNIELVLGLVGSTIGVLICVMFPAAAFICMSTKNSHDRLLAQVLLFLGALILVLGTYATLYAANNTKLDIDFLTVKPLTVGDKGGIHLLENIKNKLADVPLKLDDTKADLNGKIVGNMKDELKVNVPPMVSDLKIAPDESQHGDVDLNKADKRQEPPIPVEPVGDVIKEIPSVPPIIKEVKNIIADNKEKENAEAPESNIVKEIAIPESPKKGNSIVAEQIDQDAIKKEEEELAEAEKQEKAIAKNKNAELLRELEQRGAQQIKLLQEQKQILQALQEQQEREQKKEQKDIPANIVNIVKAPEPVETDTKKYPQDVKKIENAVLKKEDIENEVIKQEPPKDEKPVLLQKINAYTQISSSKPQEAPKLGSIEDKLPQKPIDITKSIPVNNTKIVSQQKLPIQTVVQPEEVESRNREQVNPLDRLRSPPIPIMMQNKSQMKFKHEEQNINSDIKAMRREILQESVGNNIGGVQPDKQKIFSDKISRINISPTLSDNIHDREKREASLVENISSSLPSVKDQVISNGTNDKIAADIEIDKANCQIGENIQSSSINTVTINSVDKSHVPDKIIDIQKTDIPNIQSNGNGNVNNGSNIISKSQMPQGTSGFENLGRNANFSVINNIERQSTIDSKTENNFQPVPQSLNLTHNQNNIEGNNLLIKAAAHLSNPEVIPNKEDPVIAIKKRAITSAISEIKPMKRDLKSIQTQEEKTENKHSQTVGN